MKVNKLNVSILLGVMITLFHIYANTFGFMDMRMLRAINIFSILILMFINKPLPKKWRFLDYLMIAVSAIILAFVIVESPRTNARILYVTSVETRDLIFAVSTILLILEASRRVIGKALTIIASVFLGYALFGHVIPGKFGHFPITFSHIVDGLFLDTLGVFGIPLGVAATYAFLFILFGTIMVVTKTGDFYLDIANAIAGRAKGGPAKVSVISSGLLGTITGNPVANVYGTGSFTIPLMKGLGYKSEFAGGVEAAASTGGALMPPIMGAAAFIMADFVGVPYLQVCIAAFIPAMLYYGSLFAQVHFRAMKADLKSLPEESIPSLKKLILTRGYLLLPLLVVTATLLLGYTAIRAALFGVVAVALISFFDKENRLTIPKLIKVLSDTANNAVMISVACATAGIVMGSVILSGTGLKFVSALTSVSGGYTILVLILVAASCIILGMGLPTTGAYIIVSSIVGPALLKLGFPILAAHLFILYFATLSNITPPVALAAYAGASISKSNTNAVAIQACKIGITGFIVPFVFIHSQELLLTGNALQVLLAVAFAGCGAVVLSAALEGFIKTSLTMLSRVILIVSGLALFWPGILLVNLAGFAVAAAVWVNHLVVARRSEYSLT